MKKNRVIRLISLLTLIIGIFGVASILFFNHRRKSVVEKKVETAAVSSAQKKEETKDLPNVSSQSWELVVVNRNHITPEMNPKLTTVDTIQVDSRIAKKVRAFLTAAQSIDSTEHLISGYRSVAYQKELFNHYIEVEMANNSSLTEESAKELVQTYSQPGGASEHQTGLAIDMSNVDSLNESNPSIVEKLKVLAPTYGFVLRFEESKSHSTGIGYEDWHFRYVGEASAQYMTKHQLSLEEYVALLKESGR